MPDALGHGAGEVSGDRVYGSPSASGSSPTERAPGGKRTGTGFDGNGAGPGKPSYYIGSADLMPRNLNRRVEALVPVEGEELQAVLDETLQVNLADDLLAWEVGPDDVWRKTVASGAEPVETHLRLQELELER